VFGVVQAVRAKENAAFFDTFRTYDEYNGYLDQLASAYPHLVTKKVRSPPCYLFSFSFLTLLFLQLDDRKDD
jgi:hypothetical protein